MLPLALSREMSVVCLWFAHSPLVGSVVSLGSFLVVSFLVWPHYQTGHMESKKSGQTYEAVKSERPSFNA